MDALDLSKVCFVISPISERGSEVRKEADSLLWIIDQAVSKNGFRVLRIDEITKTLEINREIIKYIRESALCVIILTGNNPNVFYEAGRRHEAGKPYIHLLKEGEKLPFDVAAINTIHYSGIDTLEGVKDLVQSIDNFVVSMGDEISGKVKQEVTLDAIAQVLKGLNQKVDELARGSTISSPYQYMEDPADSFRDPRESFMLAIAGGDIERAARMLPKLHMLMGGTKEFMMAVLFALRGGAPSSVALAMEFILAPKEWMTVEDFTQVIGSLANYYSLTGGEEIGIPELFPIIDSLLARKDLANEERAGLLNQQQRLLYGAGLYEEASVVSQKVLELVPDESSFYFNASLIQEKLGNMEEAERMIDIAVSGPDQDEDHLLNAIDVYIEVGRRDKAKSALDILRKKFPQKAALALLRNDIRDLL